MTNRKLRQALLGALKITPQALSQQVQRLKRQHPMTTEDATYVIAHRKGLKIDRYLDEEALDRVRGLLRDTSATMLGPERRGKSSRPRPIAGPPRRIRIRSDFELTDPVISSNKIKQANEMAAVYPLLYILENSIRDFLDLVMTRECGSNWFDTEAPHHLRDVVSRRKADEEKNRWHQRRGARPIDYLDLNQLIALVRKAQGVIVPDLIPSVDWLAQLIDEVYKSRCVVCHMNPLHKDNIQAVKLKLRQWQKQMGTLGKPSMSAHETGKSPHLKVPVKIHPRIIGVQKRPRR